jgi:hypothetical protein
MSKMAGFMGDNVNPEQLQEMMKNIDNPEKITEMAQQMGDVNQADMQNVQNQLMSALSGVNSTQESTPVPTPTPTPTPVPMSSNDLNSKKEMLNKLKRLKELKELKERQSK